MPYALCLLACAKKLPPPNTDVFPPSLSDVTVVNQNRIDLTFDEPMNRTTLKLPDFSVVGEKGETLGLLAIAPAADPAGISILTRRQAREKYAMQGTAKDVAGNATKFSFKFTGSSRPDTIPPGVLSVQPHPNSTKIHKNIVVSLTFSKPIDTLTWQGFIVLPIVMKARFTPKWDPTLTGLSFSFADSLGHDTVVSLILPPTFRDFTGNHPVQTGYTYFTADSTQMPKQVTGRLETGGRSHRNALVFLEQDQPLLAGVVRSDGSFLMRAKDSTDYSALAVADTNYDGYVDLIGRTIRAALPDTLIVTMQPETTRVRIDSLF